MKVSTVRVRSAARGLTPAFLGVALTVFFTAGIVAEGAGDGAATKERPLNIVLILADDLGWSDLGCQGNTLYETPRIDRLAAEGMRFTDAYVNAPNCAPSRASLMTGQYTPRHRILTVGTSERGNRRHRRLVPIPNEIFLAGAPVTLAERLASGGYRNIHVGKWHLGEGSLGGPELHGFHVNIGGSLEGAPASYFSPYRNPFLEDGPEGEYLTDRLTDEAVREITANRHRPFFLYLSHFAVHTPIQAKEDKSERYARKFRGLSETAIGASDVSQPRRPDSTRARANLEAMRQRGRGAAFAAMIESLDESVGRVLDTLERLSLTDRTLVIFISDNGGHGRITSNAPLRGGKGMLYEGGVRVPLLVRWPGVTPPGSTCRTPVIGCDLLPTILEVAGSSRSLLPEMPALPEVANVPEVPEVLDATTAAEESVVDGISLAPLLRGARLPTSRSLYWHCPVYLDGTDYPGASDPKFRLRPSGAVRSGKWKLIERFEDQSVELYDLETDLGESRNLADSRPDIVRAMRADLGSWRARVGARVPATPNPDYGGEETGSGPSPEKAGKAPD